MNRKVRGVFTFVIFLVLVQNAYSGYPTGQDLLIKCTGATNDPKEAAIAPIHCLGYIDGIIDAHGLLSSVSPEAKFFCPPAQGIAVGDAMDAVIYFIQKFSETRSASGRVVVIKALQTFYPCK